MSLNAWIIKEDPQVDLVFKRTKSGDLRWQCVSFIQPGFGAWKICFIAEDAQSEFSLEKESFLENGAWVSVNRSSLKIKDKNSNRESSHIYRESSDYVEILSSAGYPPVSALASFIIGQFRQSMNLHWSIA